jgi:hypothetical protein
MAVLTVRRPSPGKRELLFQGKHLPVGAEIDTRDFPRVSNLPGKWAQLVRLGIFYDDHLSDPELVREVNSQRDQFGSAPLVESRPEPVVPIGQHMDAEDHARLDKPTGLQCGECGHQANSEHGLKVHVGRSHKKE